MATPPSCVGPLSRLLPPFRCRRAPASASSATWATRPSWARATSRGPLPGDHRPVDTRQHRQPPGRGTRHRDPRPFRFPPRLPHTTAIRSSREVTDMTITVLDRRDGTADTLPATLGELHDAADQEIDELLPCRVNDSELWFAESPADVEFAKALCQDCPVRDLCLSGALERREPWGVWGGELFLQGVVIPRKRPRGRPRKNEQAA